MLNGNYHKRRHTHTHMQTEHKAEDSRSIWVEQHISQHTKIWLGDASREQKDWTKCVCVCNVSVLWNWLAKENIWRMLMPLICHSLCRRVSLQCITDNLWMCACVCACVPSPHCRNIFRTARDFKYSNSNNNCTLSGPVAQRKWKKRKLVEHYRTPRKIHLFHTNQMVCLFVLHLITAMRFHFWFARLALVLARYISPTHWPALWLVCLWWNLKWCVQFCAKSVLTNLSIVFLVCVFTLGSVSVLCKFVSASSLCCWLGGCRAADWFMPIQPICVCVWVRLSGRPTILLGCCSTVYTCSAHSCRWSNHSASDLYISLLYHST